MRVVVEFAYLVGHYRIILLVLVDRVEHSHQVVAQSLGIQEALLAVFLFPFRQYERLGYVRRADDVLIILLNLDVDRVGSRQFLSAFDGWRQFAQRCDKAVVACYLAHHPGAYSVVGYVGLVELLIEFGSFVACISNVKREIALLRIEHKPYLLTAFHVFDELLVLRCTHLLISQHERLLLMIALFQLQAQHAERLCQVLLFQNGMCGQNLHQHNRTYCHQLDNLIHCRRIVCSYFCKSSCRLSVSCLFRQSRRLYILHSSWHRSSGLPALRPYSR